MAGGQRGCGVSCGRKSSQNSAPIWKMRWRATSPSAPVNELYIDGAVLSTCGERTELAPRSTRRFTSAAAIRKPCGAAGHQLVYAMRLAGHLRARFQSSGDARSSTASLSVRSPEKIGNALVGQSRPTSWHVAGDCRSDRIRAAEARAFFRVIRVAATGPGGHP